VQITDFDDGGSSDDGASVSDTGDSTSDPTSDPTATAGADTGPLCGNGVLDPDEECDDANVIDGDGCQSDCTLGGGGEELWTLEDEGFGAGLSVLALPDGGFVVAASPSALLRFDADGQQLWTRTLDFEESRVGSLALAPDGDVLVVGNAIIDPDFAIGELWVSELSVGDGSEQWLARPDIPLLSRWGNVIASGPDGALRVGGFNGGEGGSIVLMVGLAADGTLQWWEEAPELGNDYAEATSVVVLPDGSTVFAGVSGLDNAIWARRVDAGGQELWTTTFDFSELSGPRASLERGSDGTLYLAGTGYDDEGTFTTVVTLAEDGSRLSTHSWKRSDAVGQKLFGTALSEAGTLYLAGSQQDPDASLYGALDGQGNPLWSEVVLGDEPPYGGVVYDAAVLSGGNVVFVGSAGVTPNVHLWIRKTEP
jgi:cysteine-rich repeat protein